MPSTKEFYGEDETPSDRIVKRVQDIQEKSNRKNQIKKKLSGEEGVKTATNEFESLKKEVDELASKMVVENPEVIPKSDSKSITIPYANYLLIFSWQPQTSNSLDNARLKVVIKEGTPTRTEGITYEDIKTENYSFDMNLDFQNGWCITETTEFSDTKTLIEKWMDLLLDYVEGIKP